MAEDRYRIEPADELTPEMLFERKWATTVLERALARLAEEWKDGERRRRFDQLRSQLTGEQPSESYREAAAELGMTEDAVKMTVSRLRRRYSELLREEVAHTIRDPKDLDGETRYLFGVLGR